MKRFKDLLIEMTKQPKKQDDTQSYRADIEEASAVLHILAHIEDNHKKENREMTKEDLDFHNESKEHATSKLKSSLDNLTAKKGGLEAGEIAKSKGAKRAILLPVSVPSHCSLMQKASEELRAYLDTISIQKPSINVIHNVDVMVHDEAKSIKDALSKQLCHPVRWVETIEKIASHHISDIAECGPGKVLTGLTKRISSELKGAALVSENAIDEFEIHIK